MFGKAVKLFVADAKYRGNTPWSTQSHSIDTPLDNFTDDIKYINPNSQEDDFTQPLTYNLTDQELQARFPSFKTDKTAKENTDVLMTYNDTEAAHWCRAQNISGVGNLDLPNIYELIVIYLESDNIDTLDPTAEQYPDMMLGYKATNGRFNSVLYQYLTSTECSHSHIRDVRSNGFAGNLGKYGDSYGVVPVKELSIS